MYDPVKMSGMESWRQSLLIIFVIILSVFNYAHSVSKYSEEYNTGSKYYRKLDRPFRMQKVNLIWEKAQKRLPEQKLKALHMDLTLQDKNEIAYKKLKSADLDKDGLKEAALRKTLIEIINKYGLNDRFSSDEEDTLKNSVSSGMPEELMDKRLFKDKKLNKLWSTVEKGEFSDEELKALKEEFQHHQEKLDEYIQLIDDVNKTPKLEEMQNSVETLLQEESKRKDIPSSQQLLKEKYRDLQSNYNNLASKVLQDNQILFEEPRVDKLWRLAQKADFTPSELQSLKEELHHYEHRIKKLKYLEAELELSNERYTSNKYVDNDKTDIQKNKEQRVKDFNYKVNKIHNELESRILQRHLEL